MGNFFTRRMVSNKKGFTLIEIIVAMMILAILSVGLLGNFFNTPPKARDAKRKAALRQILNSLEIYYSDNGVYPEEVSNQISCDGTNAIGWGASFTCDGEVYMSKLPDDPSSNQTYYYELVGTDRQGFRIYARLENTDDKCFDSADECCVDGFDGTSCGGGLECNYVITSPNETPVGLTCT